MVEEMREPIVRPNILVPIQDQPRRGYHLCCEITRCAARTCCFGTQVQVIYDAPMNEVVLDFFDPPEDRKPLVRVVD